jgi:hypothetical protein
MPGRRSPRWRQLDNYLDVEHLGNSSSATTSTHRRVEHLDGGWAPQQRRLDEYFNAEHLGTSTTQANEFASEERGNGFLALLSPPMPKALHVCLFCWKRSRDVQ